MNNYCVLGERHECNKQEKLYTQHKRARHEEERVEANPTVGNCSP